LTPPAHEARNRHVQLVPEFILAPQSSFLTLQSSPLHPRPALTGALIMASVPEKPGTKSPHESPVIAQTVHSSCSIVPGTEDRKPETKNREPRTDQVIRLTDGHRAKVEEKPEVRKAGGVHYTPTYGIKHDVGRLLGDGSSARLTRRPRLLACTL